MKSAQKIKSSTQKFIEIQDFSENVVVFTNSNACMIIEIEAVNFDLLSKKEQDAKISAYASMLNSLSFSIQIIIQNKRIDISSYLKLLDQQVRNLNTHNPKTLEYFRNYKEFVQELIKVNSVLDKKFYIVIPYSYLEKGIASAGQIIKQKNSPRKEEFLSQAKIALNTKANSLNSQLGRLGLKARILGKEDLIRTFYEVFNPDAGEAFESSEDLKAPIVRNKN